MKKLYLSGFFMLSSIGVASARTPASPCSEEIARATRESDRQLGFHNEGCKIAISTNALGAGFGLAGESDVKCEVSDDGLTEEFRRYSFHLAPGGCRVLNIAPISAPPAALH